MRYRLVLLLLIIVNLAVHGQAALPIMSENKKAIKYFQQAEKLRGQRQFQEAIKKYDKAIQKDSSFAEAYYQAAASYSILQEHDSAAIYFLKISEIFPAAPRYIGAHLRLAELSFGEGDYQLALQRTSKYISLKMTEDRYFRRAQQIKENCIFALDRIENPLAFNPRPLPPPINQFDQQYFPVLSADQKELFFIKRDHSEEIYTSRLTDNGEWGEPAPIDSSLTTKYNEGTCSVSADSRTMVYTSCMRKDSYGSCDLYITYNFGGRWTEPVNMGRPVNSSAWDSQPSLSADGRTLYFVSNRKGGLGKRDIWVSERKLNGKWSSPKNMGPAINTEEDDISPFIHVNNRTLYFSTNARPGFGRFDIYYSDLKSDGTWDNPINFGYPINTMNDELAMFITSDGASGYYSFETKVDDRLSSKLYQIDIPEEISIKYKSSFIEGVIYDSLSLDPVGASVKLYNVERSSLEGHVESDSTNGKYLMVLTEGAEYALYIDSPGYLFRSYRFDFNRDSLDLQGLQADIPLMPIQPGESTTLNNVLFAHDSYELSEKSLIALKFITNFLTDHPELLIEIAGHTDNSGTASYNQLLSEQRAKTVYNYLIEQGVDETRLFYAGYGSTNPVAPNSTDEGKALNRRIELVVLP